jgi:hypothetical protein
MHYPGFYPPLGLASPYPIEAPIPFNHYNPHNSSIELINPYFYPYNLSYHSKGVDPRMGIGTNVGVGVGMQGSLGIQQNLVGQPMGLINNS